MDMCTPVRLPFPGCGWLPFRPGRGPILFSALSLTPTRAHMRRAGREGAGVSASSCVTRLILRSLAGWALRGVVGAGLVPTAPLINMYLGLLCSKVTAGRRRGGLHRAEPLGPSQAPEGLCDPLRRDETQIQGAVPLVQPGPPHPQPCAEGAAVVDTRVFGLWSRQAHEPTPADAPTGSDGHTKTALRATGCWTAGVQGHPSPSPQPSHNTKKPHKTQAHQSA